MPHKTPAELRFAVGTDPGLARTENQDSAYLSPRLFALADGMGGHVHGDLASTIAVTTMSELDEQLPANLTNIDTAAALASTTTEILRRLTAMAERDQGLTGMGTTLTVLLWDGGQFTGAHIGDSRGYLLRDGRLTQLTRDHTMVQSLIEDGRLSPEQAHTHPRRSMLMRALQTGGNVRPDLFRHEAIIGDRYLLCSDGLTDVVAAGAVGQALAMNADPRDVVGQLILLANDGGGPDNITCVVVDVVADATPEKPAQSRDAGVLVGAASQLADRAIPDSTTGNVR